MPVRNVPRSRGSRRRAGRVLFIAVLLTVASACSGATTETNGSAVNGSAVSAAAGSSVQDEKTSVSASVSTAGTSASAAPAPVPETSTTATATDPASTTAAASTVPGQARCPGVRCLSVVVTGDVLLHPPLVEQARADSPGAQGMDFAPMLSEQAAYVRGADLGICHLETPLAPAGGPFSGYPEFSVPPQVLSALVTTGYDACSTASNHTLDQGTDGLNRTLDDMDAAGLAHDGSYRSARDAGVPTILPTAHGRVGLISVTYGFNGGPPDQPWQVNVLNTDAILARAAAARDAGADLVIVAIHAGTEYETEPNDEQRSAAATLLASPDIDLVYGHHAHVVQPLQKINGKWVIFGLGNNIAAQETPVEGTHRGLLVRVTFSQGPTGEWTTSDVAWVPSLQDSGPPHRWCPLIPGKVCASADVDAAALAATTEAVNLNGADTDGAHRLGRS